MLTKYEEALIQYWKNWKPGMGPFKGEVGEYVIPAPEVQEVKIVREEPDFELWDII